MNTFFWIVDLLIPISMIIIGVIFSKKPPANRNYFMGYRTFRSMASQEAWDYAHKICGKILVRMGIVVSILVAVSKLTIDMNPEYLSLLNTGVGIIALIAIIPYAEIKLKMKFPK